MHLLSPSSLKKKVVAGATISLAMACAMVPVYADAVGTQGTFDVYASVYDFGARVDKIVIEAPDTVRGDSVSKDTFTVESANESNVGIAVDNGARKITDIYVSDSENGEKESAGKYVIIELETKLSTPYADVLQWNEPDFTNVPLNVQCQVQQNKAMESDAGEALNYTYTQDTFVQVAVDEFGEGKSANGIVYRDYVPEEDGQKHPLIIWLHGAGEGGGNNITHINANRGAVAFVSEEAQNALDKPYVLAPQSPDYWMPELVLGDLTLNGTDNTQNLVALIQEYISKHSNIDTSRVYIGGCSMGGYQTWETLFTAPDLFAAAFPICAAYEVPTDKLDTVKNVPIWLVHAENDDTIPVQYTRDAYAYLKEHGGNVKYTEYANVQVDGEDFASHASWIYPLNNDPEDEDGTTFYDWMAAQHKAADTAQVGSRAETNNTTSIIFAVVAVAAVIAIVGIAKKKKK